MSEQPTAKAAAKPAAPGGAPKHDNVFTHKIGPLPMFGWVAIAAAILVAWRMFAAKKSGTASTAASGTASTGANTVPQFVNQTYTTLTAPAAPPADDDHDHHPPSRKHAGSGRPSRHHPHHPDQDHDHGHGSQDQDHDQDHGQDHGGQQGQDQDHGGHQRNQDKDQDQGWRSAFTRGGSGGPSQESQRSGRGRHGGGSGRH